MKITKIAVIAMTAFATAFVLPSCGEVPNPDDKPVVPQADFTVAKGDVEAEYAEVVVRHNGKQDVTWFGFVTEDVETPTDELIKNTIPSLDRADLHVGTSQTVAVRDLQEAVNYRYIAFAVDQDNVYYGTAGSLIFNTSPKFDVNFSVEMTDLHPHEASFLVSHNGHEILTYRGFVTENMDTEIEVLAAADMATIVTDGKLNEGVTLLQGKSLNVSAQELLHETDYRYIIYGIFDNDGVVISYGTPAECAFTTPIDLNVVSFSAEISGITKNSVDAEIKYNAKKDDLTWFGFITTDLQTSAAALIATYAPGIPASEIFSGSQKLKLEDLEQETQYRYIVSGINADGVYGMPADVRFSTLSKEYDETVFSVAASDITPSSATLTITHTGLEEFEYYGFFTDDLQSDLADVAVPADADAHLVKGKERVFEAENLAALTTYRYVVVGRVYGNEYGTRGEVIFTTLDYAIDANYEDFLGLWAMQGSNPYEFEIKEKVAGTSYTVCGLNGSETARYGIGTPLEVEAIFAEGKFTIVSQAISAAYVDPDDGKTYTDKFCGRYISASSGTTYFDNTMGRVVVSVVKLEDGSLEFRPGTTVDGEDYVGMRFYQVPASGQAYAQDAFETALPNSAKASQPASEAYKKWIGQWNINGTVYTIAKGVTNENYVMGSFYSGFAVNAVVDFDAATGDILFTYGETGQSVTASGTSFDLYKAGSYNDGYITKGGDNGIICRFKLASSGNAADIKPETYVENDVTITPENFGIFGYNSTAGWANFGMTIDIPTTITRASTSATSVPRTAGAVAISLKRVKGVSFQSAK